MKLIDILARELDEWPVRWACAVQDDCGLVSGYSDRRDDLHYKERSGDWHSVSYIGGSRAVLDRVELAEDHATAIITREQWEEARRALHSEECGIDWPPPIGSMLFNSKTKERLIFDGEQWHELPEEDYEIKPQWRGPEDGPPPAGTEVQYRLAEGFSPVPYLSNGFKFTVLDTFKNSNGYDMAVIESANANCLCCAIECLKPLKSDRDRWIEQSCEAVETEAPEININIYCSYAIRKTIEAIYDAGLGKLAEEE